MRRYRALQREWLQRPPINALLAAAHKYKPPPAAAVAEDEELVPGERLAALFPDGMVKVPGDG